jgi:hypothetical protein
MSRRKNRLDVRSGARNTKSSDSQRTWGRKLELSTTRVMSKCYPNKVQKQTKNEACSHDGQPNVKLELGTHRRKQPPTPPDYTEDVVTENLQIIAFFFPNLIIR